MNSRKSRRSGNAGAPVQAGVRRKRNTQPTMSRTSADGAVVRYNAIGTNIFTYAALGIGPSTRCYAGGYAANLVQSIGSEIVKRYSSCVFRPGTKIRWEPSCSFNTSGRIYVGFTDNPETASTIENLRAVWDGAPTVSANWTAYSNAVKALGNLVSFPVWQETEIPFPERTRRKRFDCNGTLSTFDADQLDRSMQQFMFVACEGGPASATFLGNMWYHDVVDVEGLHAVVT